MSTQSIPLVVLGGSDGKPTTLPPSGRNKRPLTGCKGVDLEVNGRPLIAELVDRLTATGSFSRVFIAGPAEAYRGAVHGAVLVDTDRDFGANIQAAVEAVQRDFPEGCVAFSTCDLLPTREDLELSLRDFAKEPQADIWFPIIEAPEDSTVLGASAWKPSYRLFEGERSVAVLPGHLVIADLNALRLQFMYRLLASAYQTRNRPIFTRRAILLRHLFVGILFQDLLHLLRLRVPTLTWDIVVEGWRGARKLREQTLTQHELEKALRKLFVRTAHRKQFPDRRVRIPILPALSLARDIDTLEEAESVGATAVLSST